MREYADLGRDDGAASDWSAPRLLDPKRHYRVASPFRPTFAVPERLLDLLRARIAATSFRQTYRAVGLQDQCLRHALIGRPVTQRTLDAIVTWCDRQAAAETGSP